MFRCLYDHVIGIARADPWIKCIRLEVEHTNKKAQSVYSRVGMHNIGDAREFHEIDYIWTVPPKAVDEPTLHGPQNEPREQNRQQALRWRPHPQGGQRERGKFSPLCE